MLRLTPETFETLQSANNWKIRVGGAEANVLAGISLLGLDTQFISFLPDNPLGKKVYKELRKFGVGVKGVEFSPRGRMGLYFVDFLNSTNLAEVFYDRENSSFAISPLKEQYVSFVRDAKIFHFTGITPGLGVQCRNNLKMLLNAIPTSTEVSFDTNYRQKLWSPCEFKKFFEDIISYVNILFFKEEDFHYIFDEKIEDYDILSYLQKNYGAEKIYVLTQGEKGCSVRHRNHSFSRPSFPVGRVVDKLGTGDAFVAGFLYGYLVEKSLEKAAIWGNAMAAIKMNVFGDFPAFEKELVEHLVRLPKEAERLIKR